MGDVLSPRRLAFERGRRAYLAGRPISRRDWQDMDADSVEFCEVLGWKFEQFGEMFARQRTMEALGIEFDWKLPRAEDGSHTV